MMNARQSLVLNGSLIISTSKNNFAHSIFSESQSRFVTHRTSMPIIQRRSWFPAIRRQFNPDNRTDANDRFRQHSCVEPICRQTSLQCYRGMEQSKCFNRDRVPPVFSGTPQPERKNRGMYCCGFCCTKNRQGQLHLRLTNSLPQSQSSLPPV